MTKIIRVFRYKDLLLKSSFFQAKSDRIVNSDGKKNIVMILFEKSNHQGKSKENIESKWR